MSQLNDALRRLHGREGVEHVVLLGADGLLIRHLGASVPEPDTIAAMVPGLVSAAASLGSAADGGEFATAVIEFSQRVAIVLRLSSDLLLALVLSPGIGFAPLLREVRGERDRLAGLL
jgi:predicted regulator of Ras-like GTPase activity (Roadblock/LC7/MglB family)